MLVARPHQRLALSLLLLLLASCSGDPGGSNDKTDARCVTLRDYFITKAWPVLGQRCASCHSLDGLALKRHAKLGDEVAAGAPLVTLSSIEVASAQAALRLAEQEWTRVQALGREAVSGRRYSEAQIAVEQARATAKAYGLSAQQRGLADGEFTLTAPHSGRITQDAFVIGERIEPGHTLFRLVD